MSEANPIDTVKGVYDAFTRGDLASVIEVWGDEATLEWFGAEEIPYAGTWHGKDGAEEWLTLVTETIEFHTFDPREFYQQGDTVVVLGYEKGTFRASGRTYEQQWIQFWKIQNGSVVRYRQFGDTLAVAKALEIV